MIARSRRKEILTGNEYAELITVLGKLALGVWALLPTWSMFTTATSFRWLAERTPFGQPDVFWGWTFAVIGAWHGLSLWRQWYRWRWLLTLTSLFVWIVICGSVLMSNNRSPAMVIYPLFVLSSIVAHINLRRRR